MNTSARSGGRSAGWATLRAARSGRQVVHVEHSIQIQRPVKELSSTLVEGPGRWFPRLRQDSSASVGIHVAGLPLRKRVRVAFGESARTSTWAVVPIMWKATFPQALFPVMTGKVSLSPVSQGKSRLTVSGMYEPPLGRLGEQLNEAVMRKVAKATVKEMALQIAERLERAAEP